MICLYAEITHAHPLQAKIESKARLMATLSFVCPIDSKNFRLADGSFYRLADGKIFCVKRD